MRGIWLFGLFLTALVGPVLAYEAGETVTGRVVQVVDGDTLVLQNGQKVRLVDINTPEIFHDGRAAEDGALAARKMLAGLVNSKDVKVVLGRRPLDTYGRLLGHVFVGDNWVNGVLVREGMGHVYTFEDNGVYGHRLLHLEDGARAAGKGIWALPRWAVRDAMACCALGEAGRYILVEGQILSVGYGPKGMVYLNFGEDYRTDFTARIDGRAKKLFGKGFDWKRMEGRTVRIRGKLAPVNGMLVDVSHPLQFQVVGK